MTGGGKGDKLTDLLAIVSPPTVTPEHLELVMQLGKTQSSEIVNTTPSNFNDAEDEVSTLVQSL